MFAACVNIEMPQTLTIYVRNMTFFAQILTKDDKQKIARAKYFPILKPWYLLGIYGGEK